MGDFLHERGACSLNGVGGIDDAELSPVRLRKRHGGPFGLASADEVFEHWLGERPEFLWPDDYDLRVLRETERIKGFMDRGPCKFPYSQTHPLI
jgi:hypothetical protein